MRTIELIDGIPSSALGFGCASILGAVDAKTAAYALDLAIAGGINHFDLARSYGYGEAERFVGNHLRGRRAQMVLASKFGLRANWRARLLRPLKPLIRRVKSKRANPTGKVKQTVVASKLIDRIPITPKQMEQSLSVSLRKLHTDYLDYFFVHAPPHRIAAWNEILELGAKLKQAGKIRALGLAYMGHEEGLHAEYLHQFDLRQTSVPSEMRVYRKLAAEVEAHPSVLFSPFNAPVCPGQPNDRLAQIIEDFPQSVVLCSMFTPKHIRTNLGLPGLTA